MANYEHEPDDVRRLLNLLYVIRVTEQVGEQLMSKDLVGGYHQALDDMMDAIQCEFAITDLDWISDASAEGYPMDTEQQQPQVEERIEGSEVQRLIAERNREDWKNTVTRWKPCARWLRSSARPANISVKRHVQVTARRHRSASNPCCTVWIALRITSLSLDYGCMV